MKTQQSDPGGDSGSSGTRRGRGRGNGGDRKRLK